METEADYRDPYVTQLIEADGWAIWPPVRYAYNTIDYSYEVTPSPPDGRHFLGTDGGGTDVFAKLLYGFRLSVLFGIALTMISSSIGVLVGALQGYLGGLVDLIGQRVVEIFAGLPILFVLIILASIVEPNVFWLLGILGLFSWMALVGVVRAEFLRARNYEFVLAAQSLGVSNLTILRRHVLPNAMVATLTYLPFILNGSITALTALDFLGFGLPIDSPSLGRMLSSAKANLQAPWLGVLCVRDVGDAADFADLYWRGGEGWVGSAAGGGQRERSGGWIGGAAGGLIGQEHGRPIHLVLCRP